MVDETGRIYNGDELMYLMVQDRLQRGDSVAGAVGTLMTNMAVEVALQQQGVGFMRAKVGDRYVLEALKDKGWQIGGESSGHLLALDKHTTGDGFVSALQVLQCCVRSGKTLEQLLSNLTLFPQVLINVRLAPGQDWKTNTLLAQTQKDIEQQLGDTGRILIRASGTEPLLRVMVEARDETLAQRYAQQLADAVKVG
ncbi:MAG: phosphoglucosamine mutase, partial [Comamonas sp.]|nr:phosphoglucosamine mutase [Candidatus Comamonas equi]